MNWYVSRFYILFFALLFHFSPFLLLRHCHCAFNLAQSDIFNAFAVHSHDSRNTLHIKSLQQTLFWARALLVGVPISWVFTIMYNFGLLKTKTIYISFNLSCMICIDKICWVVEDLLIFGFLAFKTMCVSTQMEHMQVSLVPRFMYHSCLTFIMIVINVDDG